MVLLIILSLRRAPPFLSIFGLRGVGRRAGLVHPAAGRRAPSSASRTRWSTNIKALYLAMANGFVSDTGVPPIDELFSRGGMESMLTTIWLILGAL